jgi:hypothetical protein
MYIFTSKYFFHYWRVLWWIDQSGDTFFTLSSSAECISLAKIAAGFNSATFKSIKQHFGEQKFFNFSLKSVD